MVYLPDTNAFSRYMRGGDVQLTSRMNLHHSELLLSSVVLAELEYGAARRPDLPIYKKRVDQLHTLVAMEFFTDEDARYYAEIRAHLETLKPNAQPIGPYDMMIAAQARRLSAVLVTRNIREFRRVPDLQVEDWQQL